MAVDLQAQARGIAAMLDSLGLTVYPWPDPAAHPDSITVEPSSPFVAYNLTFGANAIAQTNWVLRVRLSLGAGTDEAYARMLGLLGTDDSLSIFDVLRADPTMGGTIRTTYVGEVTAPRIETGDQGDELVAEYPITCYEGRG